jgi:hypothetical protein
LLPLIKEWLKRKDKFYIAHSLVSNSATITVAMDA